VYFRELACEYQKGGTPVRFDEPQDTKHSPADVSVQPKPKAAAAAAATTAAATAAKPAASKDKPAAATQAVVAKPTDKPAAATQAVVAKPTDKPAAAAAATQAGSKGEAKITSIHKLKIAKAAANGDTASKAQAPAAAPKVNVRELFAPSSDEEEDEPPATRGPGPATKSGAKTSSPANHSQGKALQRSDSQSSLSKPALQRNESKSKQAKPALERSDSQSSLSKPVLQRSESKSNQAKPAFERSDSQSKAERTGSKLVRGQAPPASETKPVNSKPAPAARQLSLAEIKCPKSAKPPAPAAPTPARPASPSVDKLGTVHLRGNAMHCPAVTDI
jgi:hypothetical protein